MLASSGICRCMYICKHVQHHCFSPHNRPTILHPAIDLPAPEQHTAHDRRFNASVPWLTPSLRCARRNLLQASPVIVALSRLSRRAVNETAQSGIESDRHWAALPCRLRLASSPPNVVLSFFPCIPKTAAAYFLLALYRRPTSSRSHSGHNGRTYARRRHLFTLEGHLRRPPSLAQHPAARPKLTHCHQAWTQECAQKEKRR